MISILAIVSAALMLLCIAGAVVYEDHRKLCVFGAIAFLVVFIIANSIVVIPTGYTGVRTTFGQIDPRPVPNGFNLKIPFVQKVERVNNKQQDAKYKDKIWSETATRTAIYFEGVTVTYQISSDKSAWIYANVTNYRDALVSSDIVASAIKAASKELSDVDATNRSIIEPSAAEHLQLSLDNKYGEGVVHINKLIISNADFDESYNQAIAAKQKAQLEAEQQAIENKRAVEKAEADAKVTRTNAEAKATAEIIRAEAEAEANRLLEKSLTESILKEMWIEKWNGELPKYMLGSDVTTMVGLDEN